jgi:hypothetical protein
MKESNRVTCLTVGIWKLGTVRSENGMGQCLIRGLEENENHQLFKCTKTQRWREEFLKIKWPNVMEKIALRQLLADNNGTVIGRKIKTTFCVGKTGH